MLRAVRIFAILAAFLFGSTSARADDPAAGKRAQLAKLESDGAAAAKAKRWEACADAYTAALRIEKTPVRLGELGLCEEAHGARDVDAYHNLREAVTSPGVDRKVEPFKRYADALAKVGARVAEVYVSSDPPRATVFIDGSPVGKSDGRTFIVTPGHHEFSAQLDGHKSDSDSRDLLAGDRAEVFLQPERVQPPATTASAVARAPTSTQPSAKAWVLARPERIILVAATGLAALTTAVGGGTGIGFELHAQSMHDALAKQGFQSDTCTRPAAPPECTELRERARNADLATYTTITAAVTTGVLSGATVLTYLLDRGHPHPSVALTVGPQGGGFTVSGAW